MKRSNFAAMVVCLVGAPALAAGLILMALASRSAQKEWVADQMRLEVEALPDDQVAPAVDRLAQLDQSAIPMFAKLLTNQRASVVEASREKLLEEKSRWTTLSNQEEATRLALLAESLANNVQNMGAQAQSLSAELATHILLRPLEGTSVDRAGVYAHCDAVLSTFGEDERRVAARLAASPRSFDPLEDSTEARRNSGAQLLADARAKEVLRETLLPGGALPIVPHDVPMLPEEKRPATMKLLPQEIGAPRVLVAPKFNAEPINPTKEPQILPSPSAESNTPLSLPDSGPITRQSHITKSDSPTSLERQVTYDAPLAIAEQPTLEVIRLLGGSDPSLVQQAEQELQRRGMEERDLHFATRLSDRDPKKRRQLVEDLLLVRDFDPTPWLFWLIRDPSADVRYAALSLMATNENESVIRHVEQTIQQDSDPRILELGVRLAKFRQHR